MKLFFIFVLFANIFICFGQYSQTPVKEKYDLFNSNETGYFIYTYLPSDIQSDGTDLDGSGYGDGVSRMLDGYVTMYQTTKDKAYLYKFMIEAMCIVENRHDLNSDADSSQGSFPRWSIDPQMYQDGLIIGSFSKFIFLIKSLEPQLFYENVYQFNKLDPNGYAPGQPDCNYTGITFTTFGQYANWLQDRVGETLYWFLNNGYWNNSFGFTQLPLENKALNVNQQVGFARALLFNGITAGNTDFLNKAQLIEDLFLGNVFIYDACEPITHDVPMLNLTTDNAYWWYQSGWRLHLRDCFIPPFSFAFDQPDYGQYVKYVEDLSHGTVDTWFARDYYKYNPNTNFTETDMIRFRNTFTNP
jgi:hypothetical protein